MRERISWKRFMKNTAIFCAMAAAYIAPCDLPCIFAVGEPEIPEPLLRLKEDKYRNLK